MANFKSVFLFSQTSATNEAKLDKRCQNCQKYTSKLYLSRLQAQNAIEALKSIYVALLKSEVIYGNGHEMDRLSANDSIEEVADDPIRSWNNIGIDIDKANSKRLIKSTRENIINANKNEKIQILFDFTDSENEDSVDAAALLPTAADKSQHNSFNDFDMHQADFPAIVAADDSDSQIEEVESEEEQIIEVNIERVNAQADETMSDAAAEALNNDSSIFLLDCKLCEMVRI